MDETVTVCGVVILMVEFVCTAVNVWVVPRHATVSVAFGKVITELVPPEVSVMV